MSQFEALAAGIEKSDAANRMGQLGARGQLQELAVFSGFLLPTFLCRGKEK
ncbi:hypothetical protein [Burkholderia sp. Ac-20365]|uniref:hypothetical protein n=1 Tax=Burkholderia sp. Ac-20365 TaxID=2703897 RepID=UPI00197B97C5|nr:hypothetical protein [Burkholderia sp. Ac-20365]MBN3766677.1 hypothetical protein [Burkholderia sp. Ac-20365]